VPLEQKVFGIKEVARYLGVHPSSVYRMLKRGEISGFKIGSDWKFNLEAIEKWRLEHVPATISTGKFGRPPARSTPTKG
jgi:excisionase family DNA binding protein